MKKRRRKFINYDKLLNSKKSKNLERVKKARKAHSIPRYYVDNLSDDDAKKVYKYVNKILGKVLKNENYTDHLKQKIAENRVYMKPALLKDIQKGEYKIIEVAKFKKPDDSIEYRFLIKSNSVYKILKNYTHFDRYEYNNLYLVLSSEKVLVTAYNSNENKKTNVTNARYKNVKKTFTKTVDHTTKVL